MTFSVIAAAEWADDARRLRDEGWFLADLTAIDRLHLQERSETAQWYQDNADAGIRPPTGSDRGPHEDARFDVVVQVVNLATRERRSIHVPAEGEDPPRVPSVTPVWPAANFMEREVYDLFGVSFDGHPNLTRIMLPDEWEGHPLRKDYGVGKITIEFIPQPFLQMHTPGQGTTSPESGIAVDELGQTSGGDGRGRVDPGGGDAAAQEEPT